MRILVPTEIEPKGFYFRTICNFKKECKGLIETAFKETVTIAKALGITNLGHISTDGTKMKANASNNYTLSKEEVEGIRRIIVRGIAIDKEEDKLYGDKRGDELPSELNTQEKIREKNLKFREFQTRGIENVRIEHNLVRTAHNLKVIWCKLGSSVAALCSIKGLIANFASKVTIL
jgi:hypothetical protein